MPADTPGRRLELLGDGPHQLGARCETLGGELSTAAAPSFDAPHESRGRTVTVRNLDVPASQWRLQDITAVRDVLTRVGADQALARAWRGSVVLSFAEVEESHPYLNPVIAGFLQKVYSEFPYLLYFLNPDPARGALDSFFATIGALHEDQHGVWVIWSDDVATAFYGALVEAAEFAINRGDDWVAVVKGYEYDKSQTRFSEIREILIGRGLIGT